MKNIIKRGTSLLLVLAMLLSFAAVVGAEGPTTTTSEKILTLTVGNVVLEAGQEKYIPVKGHIASGYSIGTLNFSISCTNGITVTGVTSKNGDDLGACKKVDGSFSSNVSRNIYTWFPNTEEIVYLTEKYNDTVFFWIKVKAASDLATGSYTVQLTKTESTPKLFAIIDENNNQIDKTVENATLNPGTAVVIPASAELPTVILTKTAFEAPTQAGLAAGGEAAGDYDLTKYVKLVTDTGLVDVTDLSVTLEAVNGASLNPVSLKEVNGVKTLSLSTAAVKDAQYKLKVSSANGNTFAPEVELPFTVSKNPVFTMAGFEKGGSCAKQSDFKDSYKGPKYTSGTAAPAYVSLTPMAFDQYGMPLEKNQYTATTEFELYADKDYTNRITDTTGFSVETSGSLKISDLKTDVWCQVRAKATVSTTEKYGEWIRFRIESLYPQPKKAIISLTDESGATVSNIIEIPTGETTKTITYAVTSFIDQNGTPMDKDTTPKSYTVTPYMKGTGTSPVSGVTDKDSTITVTSAAVSDSPITVTFTVKVEGKSIPNYLTAEAAEAETPTATLTIKKADPIASSLASMENGVSGYQKDKIFPVGSFPTELPGIRESDSVSVTLQDLRILDQYDELTMAVVPSTSFSLYRVDGEQEAPISGDYAQFHAVDNKVTLTLTNARLTSGDLALQPGTYKIKAQWNNLIAQSASFTLTQEANTPIIGAKPEYNASTLDVPYKYGQPTTTPTTQVTVRAKFENKYGPTAVAGAESDFVNTLSGIKLDGKEIETGDNSITYTDNHTSITITVNPSAAKYFGDKTEITLTAKMTATYGTGENDKVDNIPISITLRKDASKLAHLKVTGTASDGTTGFTKEATILDDDVTASYNLIVPNESSRTYTIALSDVEDQYGTALRDWVRTTVIATAAQYDNGTLTINPQSAGSNAVFTFEANANDKTPESEKHSLTLTLNFARMSFVNGSKEDYKVDMMLNTTARTYGQDGALTWSQVYDKILNHGYAKVFIKGENNTLGGEVTDKVKVVVKDNKNNVVFDSFETYTEAPKANAGTYTIELVYVKTEGEGESATTTSYPIDSTPFKITPKEVTITVTGGTITKEYDGTQNLVLPAGVKLTIEGNPADLTVDPSALQYASADASTAAINIELVPGKTCLTGAAAANYNVSPDGLTGTITKRMVLVVPNENTFTYGENEQIEAALKNAYTLSAETGTLPTDAAKRPKFTDDSVLVLTKNGAAVSKNSDGSYDAGTYQISIEKLKPTDASAQNYEFKLKTTTEKPSYTWTISKKSVDPFNVTLEAEYGINGSELYAMMKAAKVTVDGQQVDLITLYNVAALYIKDAGQNNVSNVNTTVNAGEYTVTSLPATTLGTANYTFTTAPTLKIKVKPHTLTSADIQSTDNWDAKDFTGEEQTFTAFKVSFTYNERTIDLVENRDYVIVDNSNKGTHSNVTLRIKAADGSTNYTGEARAPQSWSIIAFEVRTGDLKIYQTNTLTYDGTPKTPEFAVRVISADPARQKVLSHFTIANNIVDMWGNTATDAGEHTAGGSFAKGFSKADGGVNEFTWKILKSDKSPIQNQTASTKYGQPGSTEITVSDGVKKGLDTSDLSVLVLTDTNSIIKGTPTAKFENGKITVNWQLQGDATTIDKSAKLRVTVAETDNYKQYTFDVDVTVTAKTPQINFGFTTATDATVGYAEDTYNNPVQNAKTTPAYTSSNQNVATVASNGVVTILDVGTTIITANAPENGEYASATASYTLTVVASPLTVTASSATMTANDSVPSFTASVTGLKRGQTTAQVFQTLTASAATDGKTAGTYAVNASATLKTDFVPRYTLRFVPGTLTVNPAQTAIDVVLPIIIGGNTCANGYANCACESFYDLDASRWYHEAIDWAYSLGLMNGTTKSTFGPNAAATRAQTWTMLARIAGQDTRRSSTWYEVGQKWAMNLGITDGTNPMGSLTREQLAAMLYRYVGSPAVNGTLTFTDSANVSAWARNAMIWAVQNGILDGVGGNRLNPKGTTTRAQAAAIFMRFSKLINK